MKFMITSIATGSNLERYKPVLEKYGLSFKNVKGGGTAAFVSPSSLSALVKMNRELNQLINEINAEKARPQVDFIVSGETIPSIRIYDDYDD